MEKRYGRRALVNAIEEHESEEWLESNTKSCPSCHAKIEVSSVKANENYNIFFSFTK